MTPEQALMLAELHSMATYPKTQLTATGRVNWAAYFANEGLSVAGGTRGGDFFWTTLPLVALAMRRRRADNQNDEAIRSAA